MEDYFKLFSLTHIKNKIMGFNKLFLPDVDSLKESLLSMGNEEFSKHWIRRRLISLNIFIILHVYKLFNKV